MSPLSIVSTKSLDTLLNKNHEVVQKITGGPLFFIENVLKELQIPYTSFFGDVMNVSILLTDKGEFGKMDQNYKKLTFPLKKVTENVIVSTILDEWDISEVKRYKGNVFLDVQGYVRDGKHFGKKKLWKESELLIDFITCLKATREETNFIPPHVLEKQKNRILLITDGGKHVEVWCNGTKCMIPVTTKVKTIHTVGAGDTFFAYFVSKYIESYNVETGVKYAIRQTGNFLKKF